MPLLLGQKEASTVSGEELVQKNKHMTRRTTFANTYFVLADDADQSAAVIRNTTGIPPFLSFSDGAWCTLRPAREVATVRHPITGVLTILWEVTANFDSDIDIQEADQSPEARTPKVRWFSESEDEVLENDALLGDFLPIRTVPGERIIVTAPAVRAILEIRRFEIPPFDPNVILNYNNHTNSEPFYGAPLGSALMASIVASEEQVIDEVRVVEVVYRVKFNIKEDENGVLKQDTWRARILHEGTIKLVNVLGFEIPFAITDDFGNPITRNLDADGRPIPQGGDPFYLEFYRFPESNFNLISLGPF